MIRDVIDRLSHKDAFIETLIRNMSGGMHRKCAGKMDCRESEIPDPGMDEATQALVDVEAKTQIYHIMDELAKKGKSILFISSDLSEVMGISDRILTMRHGRWSI